MIGITMRMGVILISQDEHAYTIHDQTDHRYQDRLIVKNIDWADNASNALISHEQGNKDKDHRTRISRQSVHFPCPQTIMLIMGMLASIDIGKERNSKPDHMGTHMDTICSECHRSEDDPSDDFSHH